MTKNYYLLLGVRSDATPEEIRAAFRRRARELHPDTSGLNSGPFIEAQEAYAILSDPERRRAYDRSLRQTQRAGRAAAEPMVSARPAAEPFAPVEPVGGFRDVSLSEFERYHPSFEELFQRWWSNFDLFPRTKGERLESLTLEVVVSPEEARRGGRVQVEIPVRLSCPACGGHGHVVGYECWHCAGHGALTTEQPLLVEFPPGIPDRFVMRLPLSRYGIENFYLTLLFRVAGGG